MTEEAPARVISALDSHRAQAATERRAVTAWADAAAPTIAGWLLAAVGLDLLVTRLFLRLAIFIPKSDAAAGVVGLVARVAAVVDTLVPVVGLLLLGVLLASAGARRSRLAWQLGLVATTGVAAGGLALTVLAPTPTGMAGLEGIVAIAALLFTVPAVRAGRARADRTGAGRAVRIGLAALGLATALAALARVVDAAAALSGSPAVAEPALAIFLAGELTFIAGAIALGVAGLLTVPAGSRPVRVGVGAGMLVALALAGASLAVPATGSILLIWSVGLVSGLVPLPLAALVAGLAVAGLAALASGRRELAIGLGTVLLAGYGLAASGLVFAGLLGLALASRTIGLAATASANDAGQ